MVPTVATPCCSITLMGEFQTRFLLSYLVCLAYMFISYRLSPNAVKPAELQISDWLQPSFNVFRSKVKIKVALRLAISQSVYRFSSPDMLPVRRLMSEIVVLLLWDALSDERSSIYLLCTVYSVHWKRFKEKVHGHMTDLLYSKIWLILAGYLNTNSGYRGSH
jgi:hypothetical protein